MKQQSVVVSRQLLAASPNWVLFAFVLPDRPNLRQLQRQQLWCWQGRKGSGDSMHIQHM